MRKILFSIFGLSAFICLWYFLIDPKENQSNLEEFVLPKKVTFNEHIAPIIFENCTPCHRPGEAGPFDLITYKDVLRKAKTIVKVTQSGLMPPWPADTTYSRFLGERYLTVYEKAIIKKWVESGKDEGHDSLKKPAPLFPVGSEFGVPDLVIRMPNKFEIPGNNKDNFIVMKFPYEIEQDTFARVIEFVPDNRKLLHHVNAHLISYSPLLKKNVFDGLMFADEEVYSPGEIHKRLGLLNDDGSYPEMTPSVSNYLPGVLPVLYPEGVGGFKLSKKGALYLNDIHYGPSAIDDHDQSYFNVFFTNKKPERPLAEIILGTLGISKINPPLVIPPNEIKSFTTEYRVPTDISLITLNPHMHLLGKSFKAYVLKPGGDIIPLIRINEWDFRWQYFYTFPKMLKVSKGSIIKVEASFDNTANNPNNPFDPPRVVSEREGSMRTSDEMLQLIINYLPYKVGDENIELGNGEKLKPNK